MLVREILRIKGHTLFTTSPTGRALDAVPVSVRLDDCPDRGVAGQGLGGEQVVSERARGDGGADRARH